MDPGCLKLLASLASLDIQRVPIWLATEFTSETLPDRLKFLNVLQDLGLVTIRKIKEEDQTQKLVQMHRQVRNAVIASFSRLEWLLAPASHIPRTSIRSATHSCNSRVTEYPISIQT